MSSYATLFSKAADYAAKKSRARKGAYAHYMKKSEHQMKNIENAIRIPLEEGNWEMSLNLMTAPFRRKGLKPSHLRDALDIGLRQQDSFRGGVLETTNEIISHSHSSAVNTMQSLEPQQLTHRDMSFVRVLLNIRDSMVEGNLPQDTSLWFHLTSSLCALRLLHEAMDTADLASKCLKSAVVPNRHMGKLKHSPEKVVVLRKNGGMSKETRTDFGKLLLATASKIPGKFKEAEEIVRLYLNEGYDNTTVLLKENDQMHETGDRNGQSEEKFDFDERDGFGLVAIKRRVESESRSRYLENSQHDRTVSHISPSTSSGSQADNQLIERLLLESAANSENCVSILRNITTYDTIQSRIAKLTTRSVKNLLSSSSYDGKWEVALNAFCDLQSRGASIDYECYRAVLNGIGVAEQDRRTVSRDRLNVEMNLWTKGLEFYLRNDLSKDQKCTDLVFNLLPIQPPLLTFERWCSGGSSKDFNITLPTDASVTALQLLDMLLFKEDNFEITIPVVNAVIPALLNIPDASQKDTAPSHRGGWVRALSILRNSPLCSRAKSSSKATRMESYLVQLVAVVERCGPSLDCRESFLKSFPHLFPPEIFQNKIKEYAILREREKVKQSLKDWSSRKKHLSRRPLTYYSVPNKIITYQSNSPAQNDIDSYEYLRTVIAKKVRPSTPFYFSDKLRRIAKLESDQDRTYKNILVRSKPLHPISYAEINVGGGVGVNSSMAAVSKFISSTGNTSPNKDSFRNPRPPPVGTEEDPSGYSYYRRYWGKPLTLSGRHLIASPLSDWPIHMKHLGNPTRTWAQSTPHGGMQPVRKWKRNSPL